MRRDETGRGEARRGETRRGEARRGEARRGEARRDEVRRGEARRLALPLRLWFASRCLVSMFLCGFVCAVLFVFFCFRGFV